MLLAHFNPALLALSIAGASACWIYCLVCPRRYLALLPSQLRPNLFAGD
ncbi:MAG TPA: hypothetical protein VFZ99_08280 [Terriglobales bacterium]